MTPAVTVVLVPNYDASPTRPRVQVSLFHGRGRAGRRPPASRASSPWHDATPGGGGGSTGGRPLRAPGYCMTSSARSSTDGGIVSPSALAVLRLITSSNFVGC